MAGVDSVINEILHKCDLPKTEVSKIFITLVAQTMRTASCDSNMNLVTFQLENHFLSEIEKEIFIKNCVDKVMKVSDSPSVETLRMQVVMETSFASHEENIMSEHVQKKSTLSKIERKLVLLHQKTSADFECIPIMHRHILNFLLEHGDNGGTSNQSIINEVLAALDSVLPPKTLQCFLVLSKEEKSIQLVELSNIVFGIRLFNQYSGKNSNVIPNVEAESLILLKKLCPKISKEIEITQLKCSQFQNAIVRAYMNSLETINFNQKKLHSYRDALIYRRQYLCYLQKIQQSIALCREKVEQAVESLHQGLQDITHLTENKASVSKEEIYPKFVEVSRNWHVIQDELAQIQSMDSICLAVQEFGNPIDENFEIAQPDLKIEDSPLDQEMHASEINIQIGDSISKKSVIHRESNLMCKEEPIKLNIESTREFMQLLLQYQGFCPWTIVCRDGVLLPGRPELGILSWKNKNYVFANKLAYEEFFNDPEFYIREVMYQAMKIPELIHLLRLQDYFLNASIPRLLNRYTKGSAHEEIDAVKCDATTETPTHFCEKFIDYSYSWNEWELRRKTLQVCNLKTCRTKAQQTEDSHFRRENTTQVWLPRDKDVQTLKNSGNNPPKQVVYFCGLRDDDSKQKISVSKYAKKRDKPLVDTRSRIITLTLDL